MHSQIYDSEDSHELWLSLDEQCSHKDIVNERHYYGLLDEQFYYYWKCDSCGEEIEDEEPN